MNDEDEIFREFEHTGDLGIELDAPTRADLFARAAVAMSRLMVEREDVRAVEDRRIDVSADSDADLMHDLLAAALVLFLADSFIWSTVRVDEHAGGLAATFSGERYDPRRHHLLTEIKAVTYHQLAVEPASSGWHARIVFDI